MGKTVYLPDDGLNKRIVFGENCIELVIADTDGDGVYETPQDFSESSQVYGTEKVSPVWRRGSVEPLKIKVNGTVDKVYVDGIILTKEIDYVVEETTISLKATYLDTLSLGTHILTIGNGAEYKFIVEE